MLWSMTRLPDFNAEGVLPPGDYAMTLAELEQSMLVVGPSNRSAYPHWNEAWRRRLVRNLGVMVGQLWQVGITEIFIDGSFVEDKERPNDIDGYFVCELKRLASGELERSLNELDPKKVWTWDWEKRVPFKGYAKPQLPMWHEYRVELYPHYGQKSGIRDEHGNELMFPAAFRRTRRDGTLRGIVKVIK
jgi:hypothetical protein